MNCPLCSMSVREPLPDEDVVMCDYCGWDSLTDGQVTAERNMREEQWELSHELLEAGQDSHLAVAFRTLYSYPWESFTRDMNGCGLRFFNHETTEFSGAVSWRDLLIEYGMTPFHPTYVIPHGMDEAVKRFCRDLRAAAMHEIGGPLFGGQRRRVFIPVDLISDLSLSIMMVNCGTAWSGRPLAFINYRDTPLQQWFDEELDRDDLIDRAQVLMGCRGLFSGPPISGSAVAIYRVKGH